MKSHDLNGRVVAMTGATGGLGRAAALALRARGAKLALLDLDLAAVTAQAAELGGTEVAAGWVADVRSMDSLDAALAAAAQHFGGLDVVIANAGIGVPEPLETIDSQRFERTIDINLNGVWRTFKAALPHLQARRGYLLAVSSMAAFVQSPLNAHYTASKAGVLAMCNSLRLELKHLGIGVGTLHPTLFKTPMMDAVIDDPCSSLVWNRHRGIWKFVGLDAVVDGLVEGIEQRREMIVVPRQNALIARAPGLVRRLIEAIGFDDARVVESIRRSHRHAP